jgi:hypothetical protein
MISGLTLMVTFRFWALLVILVRDTRTTCYTYYTSIIWPEVGITGSGRSALHSMF